MLDFVTFRWKPPGPYRSTFGPETVDILAAMVKRNYAGPHRFTVITDDSKGIDSSIRILPLWNDHADIPNPSNLANPSCYRRLKCFSAEAAELIGPRFVVMDLDTVITGDLTPLFEGGEDFKIWGAQRVDHAKLGTYNWYNGSLWMLRAGTRNQVWETFHPQRSPAAANAARCRGSDQGWIAHCLGHGEATWGQKDGVYSYRVHIQPKGGTLPDNAKVVAFHGKTDPWSPQVRNLAWIKKHYRL